MLGAMNWTARWYRQDGPHTAAELADSLSDDLIRGLAGKSLSAGGTGSGGVR